MATRRNSGNTIPKAKKKHKGPAKDGECKFDGTDYPSWLGFDPRQPGSSFVNPFPTIDGDPWEKTMQMINEHDDDMCDMWDGEIQNLLVFSGLFSAVVTAFAVETQKLLEADPDKATVLLLAQLVGQRSANATMTESISEPFQNPNSPSQTFRVNAFIFTSLVLSLGTALVGIIALQWIRSYRSSESASDRERISLRQIRYAALVKWKIPTIISYLPLLLGIALLIFFIGLIDFLDTMNSELAKTIGVLVGLIAMFLVITTILPTLHIYSTTDPMPPCPYQSPQSWLCYKFFDSISPWGRKRTSYCKNWTELILDLHKKSTDIDPGKRDVWLKNSLVWIFTKFNSSHSFRLAYHCLQSIHNMSVGWEVVSEVLGESELKNTGTEIWGAIQSALPPVACTEFLSALLLLWNCPQFNVATEQWSVYKKLILLWWNKTDSTQSIGDVSSAGTSSLEDWKSYLATFLTALESNPAFGHEKRPLSFSLFWKFVALRVQDEDSISTVLDCFRVLTQWLLRVEKLSKAEYKQWDENQVLRYTLQPMFDYNVFNVNVLTPKLVDDPIFIAFLDIFIDEKNTRLRDGWTLAVQRGWAQKWDEFLLEFKLDQKYWVLASDEKKLRKVYQARMAKPQVTKSTIDDVPRRHPTLPPPPIVPDQNTSQSSSTRRNDVKNDIPIIPEDTDSLSAFGLGDLNDPSLIALTNVITHTPANVPPSRPPLPHSHSTTSFYPQGHGQALTPGTLQNDDHRPLFTQSPRSSLDLHSQSTGGAGRGGTTAPPTQPTLRIKVDTTKGRFPYGHLERFVGH
ncbi:hypothetical protein CVT24_001099 [Panaeolus cyanescens]|uniref:DUF6535 domain-containing protein n=1 Tax=Panaeolus cyanescens TaxID=181874 RepID=A0A409YTG8_9AGAR|nr:hypothetical protein CVT24_001099 [Panaeolus cyanescens]